jgi:hypothetical protein
VEPHLPAELNLPPQVEETAAREVIIKPLYTIKLNQLSPTEFSVGLFLKPKPKNLMIYKNNLQLH